MKTVITREEIEETVITERATKEKVRAGAGAEVEVTTRKENITEEALQDLAIADFIIKAIKASRKLLDLILAINDLAYIAGSAKTCLSRLSMLKMHIAIYLIWSKSLAMEASIIIFRLIPKGSILVEVILFMVIL